MKKINFNATAVKTVAPVATESNSSVNNSYIITELQPGIDADIVRMTEKVFRKTFPDVKVKNGTVYKDADENYHYVSLILKGKREWATYRFIASSILDQVECTMFRDQPYKSRKYNPSHVAEAIFFFNLIGGLDKEENYKAIVDMLNVAFPEVKDVDSAKSLVEKSRSEFGNKSFEILGEKLSLAELTMILTMTGRYSEDVKYLLLTLGNPTKDPLDVVCEINSAYHANPKRALKRIHIFTHI